MNHLPLCPTEIKSEHRKLSRSDILDRKNKTIKKRRQEKETAERRQRYKLSTLTSGMNDGDDSDSELGDFNPPPRAAVQQKPQEGEPTSQTYNPTIVSHETEDKAVTPEGFRSLDTTESPPHYQNYVPYYTNAGNTQSLDGPKDKLLEKLNYMIHLLEEQKEEKTGHVTEELILYSFLGVFVIFVVDSFARVGKYVR